MDNFCNLHSHSEFSQLDGFSKVSEIPKRVLDVSQSGIAITDHGTLGGGIKFYSECKSHNIKPILGIEAYICEEYTNNSIRHHITLLAKNITGWKNLLRLHKISHLNFYYKPRIDFKDLFAHKDGIIVLSGCPQGILSYHIKNNNIDKSISNLELFHKEFTDDFYIETMNHGLDFEQKINNYLYELAKNYNIKCLVTNDCHYTVKEHALFQDYLMCDQLKSDINDPDRMKMSNDQFYIKKSDEIDCDQLYKDNTMEVFEKCNIELKFKNFILPKIKDEESKIQLLIQEGLKRYKLEDKPEYLDRLKEEFEIIKEANLIGYFLNVYDYVNYARINNILVGPGRGSIGGCLVGYLIGIHDIDPIKHKLLFSRFYNPGRKGSLPDIDTDFPENKIGMLLEYIKNKHGQERIAHIGTYTYLGKKSSLKLLCRVLNVDFNASNAYSSIIEDDKASISLAQKDPVFKDLLEKIPYFNDIATYSSIHAAGIIISPSDLDSLVPLRTNKDDGIYISSWDMEDVEKVGLVKFDFLSLNTLDVIQDTLDAIGIKLSDIPTDDNDTFKTISNTNNTGIFQLSSDGISKIANNMKVQSIDDIAVVVALFRPGPIDSGLHEEYIRRKNGINQVEYLHPLLKEVVSDTYGVFVFQEQVIKAAMVLANFTEVEADNLRKAIGKKLPELMAQQKDRFTKGCLENKIDKNLIEIIWKQIEDSAGYSFNRAHATGYGYITYYTAYLKTHYSVEFMASLLNNNYNKSDKLASYLKECESLSIKVFSPSITNGSNNFTAKDGKIIFGLKGVKGIGEKTAKEIYTNKYSSFEDFCLKFNPSTDVLVSLAEAGTFDEFFYKRKQIIESVPQIVERIKKSKHVIKKKSKSLFENKIDFEIPKTDEYSEVELAQKEYDRLNVYLVHNPLKGVSLATPDSLHGEVYIEGFVVSVREYITKRTRKLMAFINIATNLGQIEALMFPKNYMEKKNIIKPNIYVAVEGTYEDKLLIKKIWKITP